MSRIGAALAATAALGMVVAVATPASAAPAPSRTSASATVDASDDISMAGEHYHNCGYSYDNCIIDRSNFARYHRVSPIHQHHEGCTLPGGCPEGTYYFYWYD